MLLYPNTIGQPLAAWLFWKPKKISSISLPCQECVTENCLFCTLSVFCAPVSLWPSKHMPNNTFHFCLCFSIPLRQNLISILSKGAWSRSRSCPWVIGWFSMKTYDMRHDSLCDFSESGRPLHYMFAVISCMVCLFVTVHLANFSAVVH